MFTFYIGGAGEASNALTEYQKISGGTLFGQGIDIADENTLAIGYGTGLSSGVNVYINSGAIWTLEQSITGTANMGKGVALPADGNTLAILAAGRVLVYIRSGGSWLLEQDWAPLNTLTNNAVSLNSTNGNTLAYGIPLHSNQAGIVEIYVRSGGVWTQQATIQSTGITNGDQFGTSVSLSSDGNTLAVGAQWAEGGEGFVYIFTRSGTTWTQQASFQAQLGGSPGEHFGISVSLSSDGNTLAASAPSYSTGIGRVVIFTRSGTIWTSQATLSGSDSVAGDEFGSSVSINSTGTKILIGARSDDFIPGDGQGSMYIFTGSGASWTQAQYKLIASDQTTSANLGRVVALRADGSVGVGSAPPASKVYIYNT